MKYLIKMTLLIVLGIVSIIIFIGTLFLNLSPQFGAKKSSTRSDKIQNSLNIKDNKFHNILETVVAKEFHLSTIPKYFTKGKTIPNWSIPVQKKEDDFFEHNPDSLTRLTWFGHSALFLELDGKKIFIDPMLSAVPSPHPMLGNKRFNDTIPLAIEKLPYLDAVLISHDHYDHLDYESIQKIKHKVGIFYVPLGLGEHLRTWGIPEKQIIELDWWDEVEFGEITFVATPARHFSGRGLFDRYQTLWCSWVIQGRNDKIFFGGDSGYDDSFKKIGEKYGPFDFTMLECGQYDEQWPEIHMMPEETVQAHIDLKGKLLMPIHWGSFKLAIHDWSEPVERLLKEAKIKNIKVTTPVIGESIILGESAPASKWWNKNLN